VDSLTAPAARRVLDRYVKSSGDGLQKVIAEKIKQFMEEFQAKE
jgi:hypothetical protein